MNNNLKKLLITVISIAQLSFISTSVFADSSSKVIHGKASIDMRVDLNKMEPMTDKEKQALINIGWVFNKDYATLKHNLKKGKIKVNTKEVTTDENGNFTAEVSSSKANDIVNIEVYGNKQNLTKNNNSIYVANTVIDWESFATSMDSQKKTDNSGKGASWTASDGGICYSYGEQVTCNRFNGPYGNQEYYSNHTKAQALSNFTQSDCDYAIGSGAPCWPLDYTAYRYCTNPTYYEDGAECSDYIGMPTWYHGSN
jgi:hypothetical protein